MASIKQRANGKFCVQIKLAGQKSISRTFDEFADAEAWGKEQERALKTATPKPLEQGLTMKWVAQKYCDTQLAGKLSRHLMLRRMKRMAGHFPGPFLEVTRTDVNEYKAKRLQEVRGSTVREDVQAIHKLFRRAEREMVFGDRTIRSPASNIALPPPSKPRTRIVERHELDRLTGELTPLMSEVVELGHETAMRRAEITRLLPRHVRRAERTLTVEDGKTGDRVVPLTRRAVELLQRALDRCLREDSRL